MQKKKVFFYAEGLKLAGLLLVPDDLAAGQKRPAIVFSHGYTGSKEGQSARHAKPFVDAGYVCLTFDHRCFGESEGPRGRLMGHERVEDLKSAVTFITQQPEVDGARVGLFGLSFGAAVVLSAAADLPVRCVVGLSAFGDGERWLRSVRRYHEWKSFLKQVQEDRVARVLTGQGQRMHALDIVPPPPDAQSHYEDRMQRGRDDEWNRPLESADGIMECKPELAVSRLAPKAALYVHGGNDNLVPVEEAQMLYDRTNGPKRLLIVPGATHTELYEEPFFSQVGLETRRFVDEYLA